MVDVVADLLAAPAAKEETFLGLLTQAYFGRHLLRADSTIRGLELSHLREAVILLDASFMIPLLARGSEAAQFSLNLLDDLKRVGVRVVTTDLLLREVVEHANYAINTVRRVGESTAELFDIVRGARGYGTNVFVEGFISNPGVESGGGFGAYISSIFPNSATRNLRDDDIEAALSALGVATVPFASFEGYGQTDLVLTTDASEELRTRRQRLDTYKHDRQIQAEAEAVVIIHRLRTKAYRVEGRTASTAFFLSTTKVVDALPGLPRQVILPPVGLGSWLVACRPISNEHGTVLFRTLLSELASSGLAFVSPEVLRRRFSSVINASRTSLEAVVAAHNEAVVSRYGLDAPGIVSRIDEFDLPFTAKLVSSSVLAEMNKRLALAEAARQEAEKRAHLTDRQKQQLLKIAAKKEAKQRKQSAPSRKK